MNNFQPDHFFIVLLIFLRNIIRLCPVVYIWQPTIIIKFYVFFFLMEELQVRAVIKYFQIKGLPPTEIKTTLGEYAPSFLKVKTWLVDFKSGRTSTRIISR